MDLAFYIKESFSKGMIIRFHVLFVLSFATIIGISQDFDLNDYDKNKISNEIKKVVAKIAKDNELHSHAVGYAGERTKQYDRFVRLSEIATTDELIVLMNHKKPAVRGYSFWALAKRHYNDLETIFVAHANDEELVYQINGCIGGEIPVIDFMRWVVMPQMLDLDCKKLDDSAFEKVSNRRDLNND